VCCSAPDPVLILSWSCPDHVLIMSWSCPDHVPIMTWSWPDHGVIMFRSCPDHVLIMSWSCPHLSLITAWLQSYHSLITRRNMFYVSYVLWVSIATKNVPWLKIFLMDGIGFLCLCGMMWYQSNSMEDNYFVSYHAWLWPSILMWQYWSMT
jgi:hypothetical protein